MQLKYEFAGKQKLKKLAIHKKSYTESRQMLFFASKDVKILKITQSGYIVCIFYHRIYSLQMMCRLKDKVSLNTADKQLIKCYGFHRFWAWMRNSDGPHTKKHRFYEFVCSLCYFYFPTTCIQWYEVSRQFKHCFSLYAHKISKNIFQQQQNIVQQAISGHIYIEIWMIINSQRFFSCFVLCHV